MGKDKRASLACFSAFLISSNFLFSFLFTTAAKGRGCKKTIHRMLKKKGKNGCWTTAVDDFGLWQGDEDEEDARPFLNSASTFRAHVSSKKITTTSSHLGAKSKTKQDQPLLQSTKDGTDQASASSTRSTDAQQLTVASSSLSATVQATVGPAKRPWKYTKQTVHEPVVSVPYNLPLASATNDENSNTPSAAQTVDTLPPFAYRKPSTLRGPSQQTIRAPFQPVENEPIRQSSVPRFEPPIYSPATRSQRQGQSSSSSTAPSRIFDNKSSSSKTLVSSSPYRSSQYVPNAAPKKRSYPTQTRRPQPARVTYRKSNTNQSRLSFEPVAQQSRQSWQPCSSSSSSMLQQRNNGRPSVQPSASVSMSYNPSPLQQSSAWPSRIEDEDDDDEFAGYSHSDLNRPSPYQPTTPYRSQYNDMPSSSSQSAMDQAIDREFYRSFQDSPVRSRIAADYQASRSNAWQSTAFSIEERSLRQYPQVFDQDPGEEDRS